MSVNGEKSLVAPVLWKHIGSYKKKLNIVENPSVGTMALPVGVCELIDFALERMLWVALVREADRVRVYCAVDHRGLVLGVADDGSPHDNTNPRPLAEIVVKLRAFPGSQLSSPSPLGKDKMTAELVVPLSS